MTTDEQEGRRQIEAMQPEPIKVGDKVCLRAAASFVSQAEVDAKAGRVMTVKAMEDYGNVAVCEWGEAPHTDRDTFPVRSLVRVEASTLEGR